MRTILTGLLLAASGLTFANPVTCTDGDLSRQIEVVYSDPGQPVPCEVIYDKSGEGSIETLWRANTEAGYCESNAEGLVAKLIDSGWDCESRGATAEPMTEPEAPAAAQSSGFSRSSVSST
jgi:hypothetical protein